MKNLGRTPLSAGVLLSASECQIYPDYGQRFASTTASVQFARCSLSPTNR